MSRYENIPAGPGKGVAMYRQGDVLIRRVEGVALPDAEPEARDEHGRLILAAGEATGHHHAVADPTAKLLRWVLADGSPALLLDAPDGATVRHEEHDPIELRPGRYVVSYQREYTPSAIIRVFD